MTVLKGKTNRGFTLIELLVVIAIIGVLSTVVLASLNGARAKARDVRRKVDMRQMQTALELSFDSNTAYPSTGGIWFGVSVLGGSHTTSGANAYIPGLTPTYMPFLPIDPGGDTSGWSGYLYRSDGKNYKLLSHANGPESFPSVDTIFYDPIRPTWAWMLCSGEPACSSW